MKLNLCCGQMIMPGYVNIDAYPGPGVDVVQDARQVHYDEDSIEEIQMLHCIEHFTLEDAMALLQNAFMMLKPGAKLVVEGPDVFKAVANSDGNQFWAIRNIFGDLAELRKGKDGYQHRWGWTGPLMQSTLAEIGFNVGPVADGVSHQQPQRDYRVYAIKPVRDLHAAAEK